MIFIKKFIEVVTNFVLLVHLIDLILLVIWFTNVFDSFERISDIAKKVMLDTIYHDLPKVREMYRSTFEVDFPELKNVIKFIKKFM